MDKTRGYSLNDVSRDEFISIHFFIEELGESHLQRGFHIGAYGIALSANHIETYRYHDYGWIEILDNRFNPFPCVLDKKSNFWELN